MAEHPLIDGYLEALRTRLRRRRDVDEIVAEIGDHLYTAVEELEASGIEPRLAERDTLDRFGAPDLLAESFASLGNGDPALPPQTIRSAGGYGLVGAGLWLVVAAAWWIAGTASPAGGLDGGVSVAGYTVGMLALVTATSLTLTAMIGLERRHDGLGLLGRTGVALVGLGVVASFAAWIYAGWGVLMASGTLLFGLALLRRGSAPRLPAIAFGAGFGVGAVIWLAVRTPGDGLGSCCAMWDDADWASNVAAVSVGAVLTAAGLAGLSRWLRAEEPALADTPDRPLAA